MSSALNIAERNAADGGPLRTDAHILARQMEAHIDTKGARSATAAIGTSKAMRGGRRRRVLGDLDQRSAIAKRARRLMVRFIAAMGGQVDPVQMTAARRAAELVTLVEQLRARALRGDPIDLLALVRAENLATRAVGALGIGGIGGGRKRQADPAGQTLGAYLATTTAAVEPDATEDRVEADQAGDDDGGHDGEGDQADQVEPLVEPDGGWPNS
jgi:hypothetical protein